MMTATKGETRQRCRPNVLLATAVLPNDEDGEQGRERHHFIEDQQLSLAFDLIG